MPASNRKEKADGKKANGESKPPRLLDAVMEKARTDRTARASAKAKKEPITVEEAARLLGVTGDHVRLLIRRGRIQATRFSTVWLVDAASVRQYLRSGRVPTKGRPRKKKKEGA